MSLLDKASLILPVSPAYAAGKLQPIKPLTTAFSVTRSTTATRRNKDGLIETVAANVPRLDHPAGGCPYLLLEATSTNLLQRSEDYANAYWLKSRVGSSATGFTAPDGSSNATYFEQASGQTIGAVIYKNAFTSVSSGIYTFSIWAKKGEKDYVVLRTRANNTNQRTWFNLSNGTIGTDNNDNSKIEEYPNGWYRLSCQRTSTGTDDVQIYYYLADTNGTDTVTDSGGIYIWGSQVEKQDYLTSYIPTTTAQVTRTDDDAYQTTTFDLSTNNEYSFYIDVEGTNFTSDFQYLLKIEDGSNSRGFRLQSYSFGGNEYVRMFANYDGGLLAAITPYGNTDIPFYDRNRIAVSLRSDGYSTYLNGVKLTNQSASTSISWDNVNKVDFNSTSSGSSVYGRKTYELMIFNEALSDAELQKLTS